MAAHPSDYRIVYIAKDGGVFKSTDGGESFSEVGQDSITNDDVIDLEMDPSSSDTVWCVSEWAQGEDVLFRTENAGNSWSAISPPNDTAQIQTVEVDPGASDTVFLGAAGDGALLRGVYRSTNFGSTWSHTLDSAYIYAIAVSADSNAFVFAGGKPSSGTGGIIYKSTDNGQTWDSGTSFSGEVKAIASDPTNYQKAYAATDSGAYKTTNGGSSWVAFEDGDEPYCDVFLSCAVSRANVDTVYLGGKFSVYRASAANGDWDEITSGMSPGESNAVAVVPPNLWAFNDYRTFHESTDGGGSWKTVSYEAEDQDLITELALDPYVRSCEYTFYAGRHDTTCRADQIVKSTDTGRSWSSVYDPGVDSTKVYCIAVDTASVSNATIYATYDSLADSVIVKSTDSGQSWKRITTGLPSGKSVYCLAIAPWDNDTLYAGLQDNGMYIRETADGSWSYLCLSGKTVKAMAIAPSAPDIMYAGTTSGIFISLNRGAGWNGTMGGPAVDHCIDLLVHPEVAEVIYAVSVDDQGNGYVYICLNRGHDWMDITEGLPDDWLITRDGRYLAELQIDPARPDSLFLGTAKGLYYLRTNLYYGTVSSGPVNWNGDWIFVPTDFTIGANATLNIAAGTEVYAARQGVIGSSVELIVEGEITVNGTSAHPVSFLPAPQGPPFSDNQWYGIRLRPESDGEFDYAMISYAYRGIEADSCDTLDIDHCTFHRHWDSGVSLREPLSGTSVSHCAFDSCDYGVKIEGDSATICESHFSDCNYGIYYSGSGNPVFSENTIDFSAGTFTCGIYTTDSTGANSPLIDCCQISGPCPYGIQVEGGSPTICGSYLSDCGYGIHYSGSGSPVIRRDSIKFSSGTSYYGIYSEAETGTNSPTIDSCKVSGYSQYGIYMEDASSSSSLTAVTCSGNANGIRLQSASPSMICQAGGFNSIIYNDSLGLVMAGSSCPDMRYNKIKHNEKRGVHVGGTSNPDLDPLDPGEGDGGRNSICYFDDADPNITTRPGWYYDLYNGTQNTIDAEGNYWGDPTDYWDGDDPYVYTSQSVDYDPMLASDPLAGYGGSWRVGADQIPFTCYLGQNYPNPFNAVTRIPYSIASSGYVSLRIYNLAGRLVRTLVDSGVEAGEHLVTWDTSNDRGQRVCSGVYFYRLEAKEYSQNKKLILLK